ncbi:unnamed protein product, partial [Prorocentrum cordatum]
PLRPKAAEYRCASQPSAAPRVGEMPAAGPRSRAALPALALAAAACLLGARLAFVPSPAAPAAAEVAALRGAAAVAAAAAPLPVLAEPDELVDYNFAGEFTPFFRSSGTSR